MTVTRLKTTSTRGIMGYLFHVLPIEDIAWLAAASGTPMPSDQAVEDYGGLGTVGPMKEWNGQREIEELRDIVWSIRNRKFQNAVRVSLDDVRRNKTGQIQRRIDDLRIRYQQHWGILLTDLLKNGETSPCYDGKNFFATDHEEDGIQTGSNLKVFTGISAAERARPSASLFEDTLWQLMEAFDDQLDDSGEPANDDDHDSYTVLVPPTMRKGAAGAMKAEHFENGESNVLVSAGGTQFNLVSKKRLATGSNGLTESFILMRGDGRALIRQTEVDLDVTAKAEGSDFVHDHDAHEFGIKTVRGAGYGRWQSAVKATFAA